MIENLVTGVQHLGIPTNDIEETIAFYESLGFSVALRTVNEAADEQVAFLRLKNLTVETYQNGQAVGTAGAIDHVALDVTDIQAAYDFVMGLGVTEVTDGIQYLPFWTNGVKFFTILGPNGEKIEYSQML